MSNELLFEIGTEEIPAGFVAPSLDNMKKNLAGKLTEKALDFDGITGAATPRRLTVCVRGLADRQPDRQEEIMGPPKQAAFDKEGKPTKAASGFAMSRGASVDDLQIASTAKGDYVKLVLEKKGAETKKLLPEILEALLTELPFKKSMRWGTGRLHFARPIQWLLALYDGAPIPLAINDLPTSGTTTRGHRFMAPKSFEVSGYDDYLQKLKEAFVLADLQERTATVEEEIFRAAGPSGGKILEDPELVDTVTNLVENAYAICGSFDKRFLELPREVLITSMREHQKYFAVVNDQGELLPHFVAMNNTRVKDEEITRAGHERVLCARLEDAFFFYREDQTKKLADRVDDLAGVVFQAKLGTMRDKTTRVSELAGFLADKLAPEARADIQRAATLAKADLITDMVGEFPSLQGIMGREYALRDGENPAVAKAISEHYLPLRAGSELPRETNGAIVGLADRLDTIAGCFGIGAIPTGSADPFGLRRLSLAILHIIQDRGYTLSLAECLQKALGLYGDKISNDPVAVVNQAVEFIKGRFTNDLSSQGVPVEAVEAVTSVSFDNIVDCRRRTEALMAISDQPVFTLLAGAYKRVRNIIKEHNDSTVDEKLLHEPAERKLYDNLKKIAADCEPYLQNRDYGAALEVILQMKEPVDTFFDDVMVMVDDQAVRNNRLSLLAAVSELFLRVGDFSKMNAMQAQAKQ